MFRCRFLQTGEPLPFYTLEKLNFYYVAKCFLILTTYFYHFYGFIGFANDCILFTCCTICFLDTVEQYYWAILQNIGSEGSVGSYVKTAVSFFFLCVFLCLLLVVIILFTLLCCPFCLRLRFVLFPTTFLCLICPCPCQQFVSCGFRGHLMFQSCLVSLVVVFVLCLCGDLLICVSS